MGQTGIDTAARRGQHLEPGIVVAQLGARMNYAVPRILNAAKLLRRLYTDLYLPEDHWARRWLGTVLPAKFVGKIGRYCADLPSARVHFSNLAGLAAKVAATRSKDVLRGTAVYVKAAQRLASRVARGQAGAEVRVIYGFDTASAELFQWGVSRGSFLVLEQCVAPRLTQRRVLGTLTTEAGLPLSPAQVAAWELLAARESDEWRMANLVVCPSEYVRSELLAAGVTASKVVVVPYGVDPAPGKALEAAMLERSASRTRPLRVLFAGEVGLRKGVLDLYEAAASLEKDGYEFGAAGAVSLPPSLAERVSGRVRLLGKCTRAELAAEYAKADCFVLPTYLEGSATVTYEALAWGLPVITTTAAGSVVEDGESGFVGEPGDVGFLVRSLRALNENRALRERMSQAARERAAEFTVEKYGQRLLAALGQLSV